MKYSASHMENNTFMMPLCHFLRLEWFNHLFYRSKKYRFGSICGRVNDYIFNISSLHTLIVAGNPFDVFWEGHISANKVSENSYLKYYILLLNYNISIHSCSVKSNCLIICSWRKNVQWTIIFPEGSQFNRAVCRFYSTSYVMPSIPCRASRLCVTFLSGQLNSSNTDWKSSMAPSVISIIAWLHRLPWPFALA